MGEIAETNKPLHTKVRAGAIDFVRVLGIVAIVAGHVWENPAMSKALFTWHVPVFFFLTGYLWTPHRTLRTEWTNRWRSLAQPYIFWLIALLALYAAVTSATGDLGVKDLLRTVYGGSYATRPFTTFWFATVLFFVAILYRLIDGMPALAQWIVAAAGLVAGCLFGGLMAQTPLSIASAWPCLSFVIAGRALRQYEHLLRRPLTLGLLALAVSAALIVTGVSAPLTLKSGDYGTPVLSVLVACLISGGLVLVAKAAFTRVPDTVSGVISKLALAGFVVVLTHPAVIFVLQTKSDGGMSDFALALLVPWVLGLAVAGSRIAPWAAGAPTTELFRK